MYNDICPSSGRRRRKITDDDERQTRSLEFPFYLFRWFSLFVLIKSRRTVRSQLTKTWLVCFFFVLLRLGNINTDPSEATNNRERKKEERRRWIVFAEDVLLVLVFVVCKQSIDGAKYKVRIFASLTTPSGTHSDVVSHISMAGDKLKNETLDAR